MSTKKLTKKKLTTSDSDSDESNYDEGEEVININPNDEAEEIDEEEIIEGDDEELVEDVDVEDDIIIESEVEIADDDCDYDNIRKKGKKTLSNISKDDADDDDSEDNETFLKNLPTEYVSNENRLKNNILTNYERTKLLGVRTTQLTSGAKSMIKGVSHLDPKIIAQLELESKLMPIVIIRTLPNRKKEKWFLKELKLKKKYIIYNFTGTEKIDIERINKINENIKTGKNT